VCWHGEVAITIRPVRVDDAPGLAAIHLHSALTAYAGIFPPEAPAPTLDEVLAQWRDALRAVEAGRSAGGFTALVDGSMVGGVLAGPDPAEPAAGHVSRLYVDPSHWAHGIGTRLYSSAVGHLRDAGFAEATLWVLEGNQRARAWYGRLGWRATGERKAVYEPAGIDDLRYRLTLGPA
jgi:ribosomal protein S18 acetylase RimI-like enzyme